MVWISWRWWYNWLLLICLVSNNLLLSFILRLCIVKTLNSTLLVSFSEKNTDDVPWNINKARKTITIFRIYIGQFLNSYIYILCCSFYHLRFFFVGNRFNFKLMLCRLLTRYTYGLNMQHFVSTKMRVYIGSRETRKRVIHWQ